jgi:hypothetical protein
MHYFSAVVVPTVFSEHIDKYRTSEEFLEDAAGRLVLGNLTRTFWSENSGVEHGNAADPAR